MPFKDYHGRTGTVYNVTQHGVGIIVNKRVRCVFFKLYFLKYFLFYLFYSTRVMQKRINVRVEHIRPSKCRLDFLNRVKQNEKLRKAAKDKGLKVTLKRVVCCLCFLLWFLHFKSYFHFYRWLNHVRDTLLRQRATHHRIWRR
jgi:ribosomal protein L21E